MSYCKLQEKNIIYIEKRLTNWIHLVYIMNKIIIFKYLNKITFKFMENKANYTDSSIQYIIYLKKCYLYLNLFIWKKLNINERKNQYTFLFFHFLFLFFLL